MILKYCNTLESSLKRAGGGFCAAIALMTGGVALAADEVSFTLTFADRPLPDLRSFTALRAGVKEIGDYAFCNCASLTNVIFEGESRPKIGEGAFRDCEKLKGL